MLWNQVPDYYSNRLLPLSDSHTSSSQDEYLSMQKWISFTYQTSLKCTDNDFHNKTQTFHNMDKLARKKLFENIEIGLFYKSRSQWKTQFVTLLNIWM